MKRVLLVLSLVILATVLFLRQTAQAPGGTITSTKRATLAGENFFLETATTTLEREKGLSGRTHLDPRGGMLFVFDSPAPQCFWMKDTLVPLDMLWFDANYKLVYQKQNAQPSSYPENFCSDQDAQYVVELPAGTAARLSLKNGDVLTLK